MTIESQDKGKKVSATAGLVQAEHEAEGLGWGYFRCVVAALIGGAWGLCIAGATGAVVGALVGFLVGLASLCFLPPYADADLLPQKTSTVARARATREHDRGTTGTR